MDSRVSAGARSQKRRVISQAGAMSTMPLRWGAKSPLILSFSPQARLGELATLAAAPAPLGERAGVRGDFRIESPREQKRDPAAHARAHEDRRAIAEGVPADRGGLVEPRTDGAVLEPAAGFAMAGVIESEAAGAVRPRPSGQRIGFHAFHFGLKAAEPDKCWLIFLRLAETVSDRHRPFAAGTNWEQLQFFAVHPMLLL